MVDRLVYMGMNEGGPLFQGDNLLVFEDRDDAWRAVVEADQDASVVEITPERVVLRLRQGGFGRVAFVPTGGDATSMGLEVFLGRAG